MEWVDALLKNDIRKISPGGTTFRPTDDGRPAVRFAITADLRIRVASKPYTDEISAQVRTHMLGWYDIFTIIYHQGSGILQVVLTEPTIRRPGVRSLVCGKVAYILLAIGDEKVIAKLPRLREVSREFDGAVEAITDIERVLSIQ
jgi:hypothetical protein